MKQNKNKNGEWLDEVIRGAFSPGQQRFDAEGWKQKFQEEFQVLESYAETKVISKYPLNRRIIMRNKMIKVAVVLLITIVILSIFEFAGSRDIDLASAALARTTEALKKVPWVHISCTAKRSDSDKETKSELWRNNELQISIVINNDRGIVKFRDIGKNLKYEYNPKTNEIIVSKVTEKSYQFPMQLEEYLKVYENHGVKYDLSEREDIIDGNSVRVFKISSVDKNSIRRERVFRVYDENNLPFDSYSKTLDSNGLVVLEGRMVFEYPQEGPATIYDVCGVPLSAKVYGDGLEEVEKPSIEQSDISESTNKLKALEKALLIYANDHKGKYPDTLQSIEGYLDNLQWFTENIKYLGKGKTLATRASDPIAYDITLLEKEGRTNVLHSDGQIVFERPKEFK